jgi:hypothetical protein
LASTSCGHRARHRLLSVHDPVAAAVADLRARSRRVRDPLRARINGHEVGAVVRFGVEHPAAPAPRHSRQGWAKVASRARAEGGRRVVARMTVCTHGRVPSAKAALPHGSRHESYRGCRRRRGSDYAVTVPRAAALPVELTGRSRSTCAGCVAVATELATNDSRLGKTCGRPCSIGEGADNGDHCGRGTTTARGYRPASGGAAKPRRTVRLR